MTCYLSSSSVARYVDEKIAPRLSQLKSDLRGEFRAADARQQEQLDRIEAQLTRLLEILDPRGDVKSVSEVDVVRVGKKREV